MRWHTDHLTINFEQCLTIFIKPHPICDGTSFQLNHRIGQRPVPPSVKKRAKSILLPSVDPNQEMPT
jgi:hypothetical protein